MSRWKCFDDDGKPTTGQFIFRDALGRVYPSRARRMAPDLFFHDQIYRHSGEVGAAAARQVHRHVHARAGIPHSQARHRSAELGHASRELRLERWIKLADHGWYSGDHHVHSAGCADYESPAEGVQPEDMMRHILGEDLNVGCVLSWGPCWYFQKQFFEGKVSALSDAALSDALRRRSVGLSQLALRPLVPAAAQGRRLPGHDARSRNGPVGTCRC